MGSASRHRGQGNITEMADKQKLYLIIQNVDGKVYGNHDTSGYPSFDAETMLHWVEKIVALPGPFQWKL